MLGLISDTHENLPAIDHAVAMLRERQPSTIIHLGDIISPPVMKRFAGLPMRFIYGNNDGERAGLRTTAETLGFGAIDDTLDFEIQGKQFFAYHGTEEDQLERYIRSGRYDYLLTGHTHQRRDERVGRTRVINPGGLFLCDPYSIAFLDIATDRLEFVDVLV